ncbi:MAG: hypothetical protein H6618_01165 [Deltaproteobacteria bacterium]|nr:hypothetical protein [Deltaproteobacteria bacterium]
MYDLSGQWLFQLAEESHCNEVTDLISREFTRNEPLSRSLALTADELHPLMTVLVSKAISFGMCTIVCHRQDSKIVAACVFQGFIKPWVSDPSALCPRGAPLFGLMEQLFASGCPDRKRDAELHIAVTDAAYSGYGLMTSLFIFNHHMLVKQGYRRIWAALSNPVSQRLFLRFSSAIASLDPRSFIWNGQKVFAGADLPEKIVLGSRRMDDPVTTIAASRPCRKILYHLPAVKKALAKFPLARQKNFSS